MTENNKEKETSSIEKEDLLENINSLIRSIDEDLNGLENFTVCYPDHNSLKEKN